MRILFRYVVLPLGGILMAAAGASPEETVSNLAAWAKFFGLDKVPDFLTTQTTDKWAMGIGVVLVISGILSFFIKRPSKESITRDKPNPESATTKQEIDYAVTLEEKRNFISSERPEFSQALNFDFMGDPLGGVGISGQAESTEQLDPALEEFRDTPFISRVCEIELTNHGEKTIFNLSVPARVSFFEAIQENKRCVRSGDFIKSIEKEMSLGKLKLEPDKSITFWITNSSPHFLQIDFPGQLIGETHAAGKAVIPYVYSGYEGAPISLSPITNKSRQ